MLHASSNFHQFVEVVETKIQNLTETAMNPLTPAEKCLHARIRVKQLKEILKFASGELEELT